MSSDISGSSGVNPKSIQNLQQAAESEELVQVESDEDFQTWLEQDSYNPLVMMRRFQNLSQIKSPHAERMEQKKVEESLNRKNEWRYTCI